MYPSFPFRPAPDASTATWIIHGLQGFAESVVSIVPAGFAAYARVYHLAWRRTNTTRTAVRWSEVANANHRVAHRQMQWPGISGSYQAHQRAAQMAPTDATFEDPEEGSLPLEVSHALRRVLAPYTSTETCWFAVWEGWGCLRAEVRSAPVFDIPHRRLHLFSASIEAIDASFCEPLLYHQSANLWWPDDHAWCVATEIDFMTTYVGGTHEAVAAIIASPHLEAELVEPSDGVAWASDTRNPLPTD